MRHCESIDMRWHADHAGTRSAWMTSAVLLAGRRTKRRRTHAKSDPCHTTHTKNYASSQTSGRDEIEAGCNSTPANSNRSNCCCILLRRLIAHRSRSVYAPQHEPPNPTQRERKRRTPSASQNEESHRLASSPCFPLASPHSSDQPGAKTASDRSAVAISRTAALQPGPAA